MVKTAGTNGDYSFSLNIQSSSRTRHSEAHARPPRREQHLCTRVVCDMCMCAHVPCETVASMRNRERHLRGS